MDYEDRDYRGRQPNRRPAGESRSERTRDQSDESTSGGYIPSPRPAADSQLERYVSSIPVPPEPGQYDDPAVGRAARWQATRSADAWQGPADVGNYGRMSESVSWEGSTGPSTGPSWRNAGTDTGSWRQVPDTGSWRRGSEQRPADIGSWRRGVDSPPAEGWQSYPTGGRTEPIPTARQSPPSAAEPPVTRPPEGWSSGQPDSWQQDPETDPLNRRSGAGSWRRVTETSTWHRTTETTGWPDPGDPTMGPGRLRPAESTRPGAPAESARPDAPVVPRSGNAPPAPASGRLGQPVDPATRPTGLARVPPPLSPDWQPTQARPDERPPPYQGNAGVVGAQRPAGDTESWRRAPAADLTEIGGWRGEPQPVADPTPVRQGPPAAEPDWEPGRPPGSEIAPRTPRLSDTATIYPSPVDPDTSSWQRTPDGVMWTGAPRGRQGPPSGAFRATRPIRSWQDELEPAGPVTATSYTVGLTQPAYPVERTVRPATRGRSRVGATPMRHRADEDELEEVTPAGPVAAVLFTVFWYALPVILFTAFTLTRGSVQLSQVSATLLDAAPQFAISLTISIIIAVLLRQVSGTWRTASVGLAAAVVGGGLATVLVSAISGQPIG